MEKGQVSLEYIIIIAAVLIIAGVVVWMITSSAASQKENLIINTCKQTATECKITHLANPSDPCNPCVASCSDPTTDEEVFPGAIECCRYGQPDYIYSGATSCGYAPPECVVGETRDCTTSDNCAGTQTCTTGSTGGTGQAVWGVCIDVPNDGCPPLVSDIYPKTVTVGVGIYFNFTASDSNGVDLCLLCIDEYWPACLAPQPTVRYVGDEFSGTYRNTIPYYFRAPGEEQVYTVCTNVVGGEGWGPNSTVTINPL